MNKSGLANLILRLGLAFVFLYAAVAGFLEPESWVGYFPRFVRDLVGEFLLLKLWGIFEIVLGLWILSGKKIFIPSVLASLSLLGLIIANLGAMDILFRDVAILAIAVSLALTSRPKKERGAEQTARP